MNTKLIEDPRKAHSIYKFVLESAKNTAEDISKIISLSPINRGGILFVTGPERSGKSLVAFYLKKNRALLEKRESCFCQPSVGRLDVPENQIFSRSGRKAYNYSQRLINGKVATIEEPELLPPSSRVSYEPRCDERFVIKK